MAIWATTGAGSGAGSGAAAGLRAYGCAAGLTVALLFAACSANPPPNSNAGSGAFGLPTGNVGGLDAGAKDSTASKDSAADKDTLGVGQDGGGTSADAGATGADGEQPDPDAAANSDGANDPDAGDPQADAANPEDGELEDATDLDGEPGSEEDAQGTDEDSATPPLDIKDAKSDVYDNGEDPNNPWYNTPLPDEYIGADTPDAGGSSDTSGQSLPPICTPVIGSVSVKETVGPGGKLDIVIWIDTSGSMSQEAAWVNQNVIKFMDYLAQKGIDYRVVMFGSGLGLCASGCPTADVKHFLWVQQYVSSTNGPNLISTATQFNKYKAFLRPDATHNIVAISDDNCSMLPATFVSTYENLLQGAGLMPKFIYHSIVSFVNAANPAQTGNCPGGASYGSFHIGVSKSTNGSMFQLCQKDWTLLFDDLSKAVAATAKPVCTYKLPLAAGKQVTWKNVKVSHIENQVVAPLTLIPNEAGCANNPSGWFYDDPLKPTTATLCEATCKKLVGGAVTFNFGCPQTQLPGSP